MSFDEEHLDPHGECAAEIHRLQAENASLAAQLAVACDALKATATDLEEAAVIYRRTDPLSACAGVCERVAHTLRAALESLPAKGREVLEVVEAAKRFHDAHKELEDAIQAERSTDEMWTKASEAETALYTALSKLGGG